MGSGDPELYLEIRKDGAPMDPARWLKSASAR
jgi:septal ring factor EnvC (AmiA/AmiB activator)